MKQRTIVNLIYGLLWLLPIYFFGKDFFHLEDLRYIFEEYTIEILKFSVYQALISSILAFLIALIPAYYVAYKKNILSKLLQGLIFIPFFFPVISTVTVFSIVFSMDFLKKYEILYSLKAILIANIFYNSPIFIKYISEGIKKIPRETIEAFKLDGANELQIAYYGKLPLLLPQIFRGFILVFTYAFTSFGIVLSLGGIKYSTLEVEIGNSLKGSMDFSKAFSLGLLQFFMLLLINSIGFKIDEYELNGEGAIEKVGIFKTLYSLLYIIFQYGILAVSFIFSFYNFYENKFSLIAIKTIFSKNFNENYPVLKSISNSILISGISAICIVMITYLIIKNYSKLTDIIIFSNLGISGAFLAISLYYLNVLFDIPLIILVIIGNIFISIPVAYSLMYQYVKKFPKDLYEMSLIDCTNWYQRYRYVELPILKNLLISALLQIFAVIFGEFTLVYIMQIEDILPLVSLVNYSLVSEKKILESSALSSCVVIIILFIFILGEYFKRRDER